MRYTIVPFFKQHTAYDNPIHFSKILYSPHIIAWIRPEKELSPRKKETEKKWGNIGLIRRVK